MLIFSGQLRMEENLRHRRRMPKQEKVHCLFRRCFARRPPFANVLFGATGKAV